MPDANSFASMMCKPLVLRFRPIFPFGFCHTLQYITIQYNTNFIVNSPWGRFILLLLFSLLHLRVSFCVPLFVHICSLSPFWFPRAFHFSFSFQILRSVSVLPRMLYFPLFCVSFTSSVFSLVFTVLFHLGLFHLVFPFELVSQWSCPLRSLLDFLLRCKLPSVVLTVVHPSQSSPF